MSLEVQPRQPPKGQAMTLCVDTETAVVDSIDQSICEVFEMMAGATLAREGDTDRTGVTSQDVSDHSDVTVVMGLTGDLQGTISVCMTPEAAIAWTESLLEERAETVDQTVIDAVGELGNMVVGGSKRRLTDHSLTMSLPSVIRAGVSDIAYQTGTSAIEMKYGYDGETIKILISLKS